MAATIAGRSPAKAFTTTKTTVGIAVITVPDQPPRLVRSCCRYCSR